MFSSIVFIGILRNIRNRQLYGIMQAEMSHSLPSANWGSIKSILQFNTSLKA